MAALGTVREAVKATLDAAAIPGLEVYDDWPETINVSPGGGAVVIIKPTSLTYGETFGADMTRVDVELHVFVSLSGGFKNAQDLLDPYLSNTGGNSILQAIRADTRHGDVVLGSLPSAVREIDLKVIGGSEYKNALAGQVLFGAVIDMWCMVR